MGLVRRIKSCARKIASTITGSAGSRGLHDRMLVELPGLRLEVERYVSDAVPHEVTLVLPRVEIRRTTRGAGTETTEEYVYSSITAVHAPRHPEAGRDRSRVSMDNRPALLYTLRRRPTAGSNNRFKNAAHGKEVDNSVLDRRDPSNR